MDYKSLLSLAEKKVKDSNNEFIIKKRPKEGQTSGPNKEVIEAFKARKQREELEKQRKLLQEKEKLMALRAQNSKSMKKAKMMKTRTKDNDFSRIILTDAQIEEQRRVEEKLKRKGTQDLNQIKKQRNELEDNVTRNGAKNLNNKKLNGSDSKCDKNKDKNNNENRVKPRTAQPSMSYTELMSLATEKAKTEKKSLTEELMAEVEEKKQMRPMTQKEKDRLKEEMFYKQRAEKGMARLPDPQQIKKNSRKESEPIRRQNVDPNSKYGNNKRIPKTPITQNSNQRDVKTSDKSVKNLNNNNINNNTFRNTTDRPPIDRRRESAPVRPDSRRMGQSSSSATNKTEIMNKMNNRLNTRDKEYNEKYLIASKERQRRETNESLRPPNRTINDRARPPSPSPMRRAPPPPKPKLPPIGSTYRRGMYEDVSQYVDNEYEEEDDDMSDFIDDGPDEKPVEEDYSRAIREIFGYDKRKYRNIDDEDIEEANFKTCMQEEARSARIGLMEDLEEERKEKEELRQKALLKKRLKN